ncbi:MAG: type IX secretion system PorP/SprF family membrane protein [Paraglaciecola sp.]|jgi:type IX secretion system PorP/SprF family membrane protein
MKKFFILLMMAVSAFAIQAQEQAAVFDHYTVVPIVLTPAVAGFDGQHQIQMNLKSAWVGFPGSAKTYGIQYHGPVGKILGLGVGVLSENIGNTTLTRFQLNYAAHFEINKVVKLGVGFSTDFYKKSLARSVLESDLYDEGDIIAEDAVDGENIFDAALGFWGKFNDLTYVGLTFPNLVVAKIGDIETESEGGSFFKSVIFNLGHKFDVSGSNLTLEPSLMIRKMLNVPIQAHFNIIGGFMDEQLLAGLSFQAGTGGAMGLLLGTKVDVFKVYYSYGLGFSNFQQYSNGSHEITVGFAFDSGKKKYDRD